MRYWAIIIVVALVDIIAAWTAAQPCQETDPFRWCRLERLSREELMRMECGLLVKPYRPC